MSDTVMVTVDSLIGNLADCRARVLGIIELMKPLQAQVAAIAAEEEEIKSSLLVEMAENGDKTKVAHGLEVRRSTRTETKIVDPDAVSASLMTLGLLPDCQRTSLDAAAVKRMAKEHDIAGLETTTADRIEVREA